MSSILNERSFDIMTSVAAPSEGYFESKNEYSFGLENTSILGSIMKWRSREYAAADKLSGNSAEKKESSKSFAIPDRGDSIDPFRQRVAGLGRATSLLDESNNSDIFVRAKENSNRPAPIIMPNMANLHISKPATSSVALVPPPAATAVTSSSSVIEQQRQQQLGKHASPPPAPNTGVVTTQPAAADFEPNVDNEKLEAFFSTIPMSFLNPPRQGKKLLVLDLDHTLLDFTRKETLDIPRMKRPFMDEFLSAVYPYYDLAIWSQTHWKYIEIKVTQLGIVSNPNFKVCFILDKTSMYNVSLDKTISNKVKPLQLIWSRYPNLWSSCNTVHVDDIEKNFMLNKSSGILIAPFNRAPLPLSQGQQLSLASSSSESVDSSAGLASCSRSSSTDEWAVASPAVLSPSPSQSESFVQCGVVSGCGTSMWKQSHAAVPAPPSAAASSEAPQPPYSNCNSNNPPDRELAILSRYLVKLAAYPDVSLFDHSQWNRKKISV